MKKLRRLAATITYLFSLFVVFASMGFIGLYLAVGPGLPEVDSIREIRLQTPMRVYSSDNQLIAEFGDTRRIPITLDQVPKNFINALLATEDQRFYEHSGVDLLGVLRAFKNLAVTQSKSQGASTITMLVARNYYLTRAKRFSRKITEMFLAWKIESELSKNEILELFLNKIHFSHRAYGLGAASQIYYGKPLNDLTLAQLATLAGIPKGESMYNPISNPENALRRRQHVLGRMLAENYITQEQYETANAEPIETKKHGLKSTVYAPYLAEMVRSELIDKYGLDVAYNDGLKVYTTLNPTLQNIARSALREGLEEYDRRHGYRGPENNFPIDENTSKEQVLDLLSSSLIIGNLHPALVIEIDETDTSAKAMLKSGEVVDLLIDDIKWARKYVDENHRGQSVRRISQVLNVGDLVRLKPKQTESEETLSAYELGQIPDATAGFVSLNPNNGAVESLVGGYDINLKKFNIVTQASRQVGSNIKPFIYSAAFEKGYTPASIINDMPIVEEDITAENVWRPKNDGDNYLGPTSLRTGLRRSRNTVSIRLIREIDPFYAKQYLENVGFNGDNLPPYMSLALGSASFTPYEVVKSYATLANGGYKVNPWFIERIEDIDGRILYEHQPMTVCKACEVILDETQLNQALTQAIPDTGQAIPDTGQVISDQYSSSRFATEIAASTFSNEPLLPVPVEFMAPRVIDERNRYLINDILKDVIHNGTATPTLRRTNSPLLKRYDLAGKTGTTNDAKDAWFSGYNSRYVATTWVGFEQHHKKLGVREFGGRAALPIWQKFMEQVLASEPEHSIPIPEGIVRVRIDPKTGLLADAQSENSLFEVFRTENAPTTYAEKPIQDIFIESNEKVDDDSIF